MRRLKCLYWCMAVVSGVLVWAANPAYGIDSDVTRRTLTGIQGVMVVVEELQPNIQRYVVRFGLQKNRLKEKVESALKRAGIRALPEDQWLKTPGRPFLHVVINTHEYEKYWYAYDIQVKLTQGVFLERDPSVRSMASTWGISMTGTASIGKLDVIETGLNMLVNRFIEACRAANPKKPR